MKKVDSFIQYKDIVDKYCKKGVFSNNYIQNEAADLIVHDALFVDQYTSNVFFFVIRDVGMRLYYYINDLTEGADFSAYGDLVIEILFRNNTLPSEEIDYFLARGFRKNVIRDQYSGIYKNLERASCLVPEIKIEAAQSISDVEKACLLFNSSFDAFSGDYIPENKDKYEYLRENQHVLIAYDYENKQFLGALHQDWDRGVNVLKHVAVVSSARGKGVGRALLDAFIERNHKSEDTRYMLWVQQQNEAAVRMYRNKGFQFINKSTISLIKDKSYMEKLLKILKGIRPDVDFENEKALIEDGILDSFDVVSIISELDDVFGVQIKITELDPENFNSVESIWNLVQRLKS